MDVAHDFCDECPGCQPCILDLVTGSPMPESEEPMISILRMWRKQTTYAQRRAFIRVTVHNWRKPNEMKLAMLVVKRMSDILLAYSKVGSLMDIFVFGSNLAGRHGKGAALEARRKYGAIYGQGQGIQGNSYAIPTKDYALKRLPPETIGFYVGAFLQYARLHPEMTFNVTTIGCGLAGYQPKDIAPLFRDASANCRLPLVFVVVLRELGFYYSSSG